MLYCFLFFQIVPVLSRPGWSRPQLRRLPCLALHFISRASRGQQPLLGPQLDQQLWVPTSWTSSFGFLASWTSPFGFPTKWTGSFGFLASGASSLWFPQPQMAQVPQPALLTRPLPQLAIQLQ